jgi:hypothetical protein
MFCWASIENTNSLPIGGPGRRCRSRPGRARRTSRPRCAAGWRSPWWSSWPGPPARRRSRPRTGTRHRRGSCRPRPGPRSRARSIQSARRASPMPHGSPLFSRFLSIPAASTGNADSISTWWRRIPSMWSMCSMSTGHSSTHAPQLVQDHSTSGSMTPFSVLADQRAGGLLLDGVGQVLAFGVGLGQQVGGLGEGVVAQVQDDLLGRERLAGAQAGHWDWHRPHSVQVAMSSRPFQVKSSILPRPNTSVSGSASSKSSTLPLLRIGSAAPRAFGRRENRMFSGASAMCRCLE